MSDISKLLPVRTGAIHTEGPGLTFYPLFSANGEWLADVTAKNDFHETIVKIINNSTIGIPEAFVTAAEGLIDDLVHDNRSRISDSIEKLAVLCTVFRAGQLMGKLNR